MLAVVREVRRFFAALPAAPGVGVAAVSGGADSVALLCALVDLKPGAVAAVHVNHQLRGDESDADEAFVRELAAQLDIPCHVARVDVASRAVGANLEATARQVRYEFLAEVAREVNASWIATGHTADDQAETVLHRLIRGAGLQGLRGIAPVHECIVRPLLGVTRADVLDYLAALGQPYREDSSNADPRFTRNRIRRELLPLLRTFNPDMVSALVRLASQAGEAFDVLQADAATLLVKVELPRAGRRVVLDAVKLKVAHPYLVRELFRGLWQREGWPASEMNAEHWTRLVAIARGEVAAADFPEGLHARRAGVVVQVYDESK